MKRLTPATVTLMMLVTVGFLTVAYLGKRLLAVESVPPDTGTRNVPMAIADIIPGTVVTEEHLGQGPMLKVRLQPDVLLNNRVIVGRVAKEPIPAATPIHTSQLFQPGERPPLQIDSGMRAVSVSLGASVAIVDGLIQPGQFVDVHMTPADLNGDARLRGGLTLTLFKGVKILAINQNMQAGPVGQQENHVTLELSPEQANVMILARERGTITLTYNPEGRGDGGVAVGNADRATLDEILGLQPLPGAEPAFVVETFRGAERQVTEFRNGRRVGGDDSAITPPSSPQPVEDSDSL